MNEWPNRYVREIFYDREFYFSCDLLSHTKELHSNSNIFQVADVTAENKRLVEPLKGAQAEMKELRRQLQNYGKDKVALTGALAKLQIAEQELQDLRWASNALEIRFEKVLNLYRLCMFFLVICSIIFY